MTNSASRRTAAQRPDAEIAAIDRPKAAGVNAPAFGSDVAADALRATGVPYIALNPGASYRGFHDSIVNYLGNEQPQMLLCLHEESAIAIAHGYAKVTGQAMAAAVHSNVGLMHGTMAIFNAWCDRMPVILLGATGPVDTVKRRPWIDWIHTARDQGALVRGYTKWDDQPSSPTAAREAILRAAWIANTAPCGPTYVNLDAGMQEEKLAEPVPPIDPQRFMPPVASAPPADAIAQAAKLLQAAKRPVILAGRVSRDLEAWNARIALAERLAAKVVTDLKIGASFPTEHYLHAGAPGGTVLSPEAIDAIRARRRHSQSRLGRCRRLLQVRRRRCDSQSRPGIGRPSSAQRLEHGLSGPAAGRCLHRLHARCRGAGFARSARAGQAARGQPAQGGALQAGR